MKKTKALLARIRADAKAGRFRHMDLAAAAGVTPSTLNTMLDPDWTNRAVANVEAIEAAYLKIKAKDQRAKKRARSRKEIRPDWAD